MTYGFVLSRNSARLEKVDYRFGEWCLEVSDYLRVTRLTGSDGAPIGVILGWTIDPSGPDFLQDEIKIDSNGKSLDAIHAERIEPLIGTYLAILDREGETRIYMDGLGSLSLVYDPANQIAGSTAACILSEAEYSDRFDAALYRSMEIDAEGWFPVGLTAHRGVERLTANHYLDCRDWSQKRHTAYERAMSLPGTAQDHLEVLADQALKAVIALVRAGEKVTVGLTGGGDSRLLLAALKPVKDDVEFYTVTPPNEVSDRFDLIRAEELAARFGLEHDVLPFVRASDDEAAEWDRRVSRCVITANRRQHPSVEPLCDHICIGGLGGEVGRCFLWPDLSKVPQITPTTLVDMLKLPRVGEVVRRVEKWMADLPEMPVTHLLDLAYIELRMSSWSSVQSYANPKSVIIHPLGTFTSIEAMMSMPAEYRQNDGMIEGLIAEYWPELLELPINRYGDWRDLGKPLAKIANPTKVYRKLRQMLRAR